MSLSDEHRRTVLALLVTDGPFEEVAQQAGLTPGRAREWIAAYLAEKAALGATEVTAQVSGTVEIVRDRRGVPHIFATEPADLFTGLGYAEAQDRLWQLDYLRRQAHGRLSEVFGPETLQSDALSRTLGITGIAEATYELLAPASRVAVDAFARGVNLWLAALPTGLPVEFELLGYEPEPWRPQDSLAVVRRWWWYLTGRLAVLTTPEVVRAALGDGERLDAFFSPDGPVTYIVPAGEYDPGSPWPERPMDRPGAGFGVTSIPAGSNNWAAAPGVTERGRALLASDPHVYFTVPADWYEVHLHAGGAEAFGVSYPSMPGILIGRNRHVAWGVTNNICSLRDLYVERLHPSDDGIYRDGTAWRALGTRTDEIAVKGEATHKHVTRYAHGRPLVDHLLPAAALPSQLWPDSGYEASALSLAWVGFEPSDELSCLLQLSSATTVAEAAEAYRAWRCPTFNMVFADTSGSVGYPCVGAIPLRGREHRGYRSADDPLDAWTGVIPFDGLPRLRNPARGWIASANNPTAPPDFPYPLSGTWAPEDRAARAEHLLSTRQPHSMGGFAGMQTDVYSGRAARGTPGLLAATEALTDPESAQARAYLAGWDFELTTGSVAASIYYVFLRRWHLRVVGTRFTGELLPLVVDSGWGLSASLLHTNVAVWFTDDAERQHVIRRAFREALDWLGATFGPEISAWRWGELHRLGAVHPAARTPLQHELLDIPPRPHAGGASTLAAAFYTLPGFDTRLGANYRLIAELGPESETSAICWPGQSGHAGSPHYADQVDAHVEGRYVPVALDRATLEAASSSTVRLIPESAPRAPGRAPGSR